MTAVASNGSAIPIQLGKLIVEIASGQAEDRTEDGKNPAAVGRGQGDQPLLLHFMHYNFLRIHQSLPDHPGDGAGATTKLWSLTEWFA
jgi:hypothetical protein